VDRDEDDRIVADPVLPPISLPAETAYMPFLSHVFGIRLRGDPKVWRHQGRVVDGEADRQMPSLSPRWVRSGAVTNQKPR
jgi:hypothetical protein